ncbi:MAG TPA: twin-arginine translocation signal domain-containing protein [Terriglobales bacterium]|nr:twin-arginine translocation signal domain-containing protein [Terriglobales bacterium]
MKDPHECAKAAPVSGEATNDNDKPQQEGTPADSSRRSFLGKVGMGGAAAMALAALPLEPLIEGKHAEAEASVVPYRSNNRSNDSFNYRKNTAISEKIDNGVLPDNGDSRRFTDFSGSWSKCLIHDALGIVRPSSWISLAHAMQTGRFSDFENVQVGNPGGPGFTGTLNGPMGALAFDLEGLDAFATGIPPAPSVSSAQTAAEEVEHYWGALMRDVQFEDYPSSGLAAQACADLNNMSYVQSQNSIFPHPVTPQNLFRGQIVPGDGSVQGPFLSQFLLQPCFFGVQPMSQLMVRFLSVGEGGADYLTNPTEYLSVESGFPPSASLSFDPVNRHMRMGRDMAAYTHVDALHQAYFTACLILAEIGCPPNPGNPYNSSLTQHGFGTFGGPEGGPVDAVGTVPEMATRALKAAWFHKWVVNLRQRPEEVGALVHARLTNQNPMPQAALALHPDLLNSAVLPIIHGQYGTYLLPQAFPEGAPAHPCYPTGHGTVGGACITAMKFFFDGSQPIRALLLAAGSDVMVPTSDGLGLTPYTGADRDSLTVNGELSKLAWNITTGHGIHAGIHFRSSSYYSIVLGEQVGLSVLKDRARSYAEPFTIQVTKFDGTTATISNQ